MVKLRDLQYLVAVDDFKHFGKAAEACFVSQPTLSGQIMKLEEQLNLKLIERHKRKVLLTPAGESLISEARNVIQAADSFEARAKNLLDPFAGELHVGLIPTLAPYILPHIMAELTESLPKIHFYLHEEKTATLLSELNQGKLDFLILPYLAEMDSFEHYELFNEELVLTISPSHVLATKAEVSLEDLNNETVLTLEDGHCLRDQTLGYCFSAGAHEDQRFRASSLETLRYMAASKMGVTLLPKLATLNHPANSNLTYVAFSEPKPSRKICLLVRPNYPRMDPIRTVVSVVRQISSFI